MLFNIIIIIFRNKYINVIIIIFIYWKNVIKFDYFIIFIKINNKKRHWKVVMQYCYFLKDIVDIIVQQEIF